MLLSYLDESYNDDICLTVAVVVPDAIAQGLIDALDDVAMDWGHIHKDAVAEFHAHEIMGGKGIWHRLKGDTEKQLELYDQLLKTIGSFDVRIIIEGVGRKELAVRYSDWPGSDTLEYAHRTAITYLLERINEHARRSGDLALVIADEVDQGAVFRRDLAHFRRWHTHGWKAQKVTNIIDTIHFSPSDTSRLLQAADLVGYLSLRRWMPGLPARVVEAQDELWEHIKDNVVRRRLYRPDPR